MSSRRRVFYGILFSLFFISLAISYFVDENLSLGRLHVVTSTSNNEVATHNPSETNKPSTEETTAQAGPNTDPSEDLSPTSPAQDSQKAQNINWKVPDIPQTWEQIPAQKRAIDFFNQLAKKKFLPVETPILVGINDQGFEQYHFKTKDGDTVTQWNRSNETMVEEVQLANGDKIMRRGADAEFSSSSVMYENKQNNSTQQVSYRKDGSVESYRSDHNGRTIMFNYDSEGRLLNQYDGPTP